MLTQKDIEEIEQIVEEKVKFLPTKDEFFTEMAKVMGELKAIREEQELITHHVSKHTDQLEDHDMRIKKLEHPHHISA